MCAIALYMNCHVEKSDTVHKRTTAHEYEMSDKKVTLLVTLYN